MPDNWGFVLAAYGLAAVVLIGYWRMLVRQESDLEDRSRLAPSSGHLTPDSQATSARAGERSHAAPISGHPTPDSQATSARAGERSHAAPISGHPRPKPDSRHPLQ